MPAAVLGCHTSVPALAPVQASPLSPAGSIECAGIAIAEQDGPPFNIAALQRKLAGLHVQHEFRQVSSLDSLQ